MLRTAKDCLKIREEKLNMFNKTQEEIKGQMKLIESKVMNANIDHETKYIDLGNVGKLFSENEKQIIKDGYYITQDDKNGTRLYFDVKDYNDYVNSNKNKITDNKDVKETIRECSKKYGNVLKKLNDDNSEKKTDLKNNLNKQEKDNNKVEAKEYDTFEELATDIWNNIFKYNL